MFKVSSEFVQKFKLIAISLFTQIIPFVHTSVPFYINNINSFFKNEVYLGFPAIFFYHIPLYAGGLEGFVVAQKLNLFLFFMNLIINYFTIWLVLRCKNCKYKYLFGGLIFIIYLVVNLCYVFSLRLINKGL